MKSKALVEVTEKLVKSRRPSDEEPAPAVKGKQLTLSFWPDSVRGIPNTLLRSALFTVSQQRETFKKRELIRSVGGVEIRFKGERFNQSDLDLYEQLVHLARLQPLGSLIEFTAHSILKELGRGTNGKAYEEFKEDMARLRGGFVEIKWFGLNTSFGGGLLSAYSREESTQRYTVKFDSEILGLYVDGHTFVDWEKRKALKGNSLAQWLMGYYASHVVPYEIKVETIKDMCGSKTARLADFRRMLRTALDELVRVGCIHSWAISKDDLVQVKNVVSMSQTRHLLINKARLKRWKDSSVNHSR